MTRLGLVVSTLLLHAVSVSTDSVDPTLLEGQCTHFETAQNASYVSTWRSLNDGAGGSYTRVSHSAVALTNPDRVLIIGGIEYESAQPVVVNTTIVYDVAADAFKLPKDQILSSTAPPPSTTKKTFDEVFVSPASRVEHASFVYENAVFVFGGQTKEFRNDSWRLCVSADSTQAQWDELVVPSTDVVSLAASPSPRVGHSVATVFANASFIGALVYGGLSADYVELRSLHLALISKTSVGCGDRSPRIYWRTLNVTGVSPSARSYHSATTVSRRFSTQKIVCLFVFGGKNLQQNQILGDMWRLCPTETSMGSIESQTYAWEQLTPIGSYNPGPRHGSAIAFIDDGKVAIAGGSYTFPNDFLRDMWEFNINATQWLSIRFDSDFLPPRRGHSITLITSKQQIFLFGGKDRYSVVKKRMDVTSYVAPYCGSGLKITLCEATNTYVCVPCPAGYYLEAGTRRCLACAAGTYSSEGVAVCSKCPPGTYNTLNGQTSIAACVACPLGASSNLVGASLASTCVACSAGSFASALGSTTCSQCPGGTYSNANASSCSPCQAGEWSSIGAATCSKCSAGLYNPLAGSAACFSCPKGFYSVDGVAGCTSCPVNTYASQAMTAQSTGCLACPALMFGTQRGQDACRYCPEGSSLVRGACQPCGPGSYASAATGGGCAPCPLHSYAALSNSTSCVSCPSGLRTMTVGVRSLADCVPCTASTDIFDGSNCRACSPGSFVATESSPPGCELCAPGTYTRTSDEASQPTGCQRCASMSTSSIAGATTCGSCPDNSYAMAQWTACISCQLSFLVACILGRNGAMCSGNGQCVLRGCVCAPGWSGVDCSEPQTADTVANDNPTAVLYFPSNQTRAIRIRSTGGTTVESTFSIRVARSGSLATSLQAQITVITAASNASAVPTGIFPMAVAIAGGEADTLVTFTTSQFTGVVGSNCRSLTLELVDTSSPSVVSRDSDRTLTLFFDDFNGQDGGNSGRSVTANYVSSNPISIVSAILDRTVSTQLQLRPDSTASSGAVPLNLRIVLDPGIPDLASVIALIPAMIAQLQTAFTTAQIRIGLVNLGSSDASTSVYQPLADIVDSLQASPPSSLATLSWSTLAAALSATNQTQWTSEDNTQRRFVVVFARPASILGDFTPVQTALAQAAAFTLVMLPPGSSPANFPSLPTSYAQVVALSSINEMPQRVASAFQNRLSSTDKTNVAVSILENPGTIVSSVTVSDIFTVGGQRFPVVNINAQSLSVSVTSTSTLLSLPGLFQLRTVFLEPGVSCFTPSEQLPMDDNAMSGWIGSWHILTAAEWTRQWKPAHDTSVVSERYNDKSLLRSSRTTVLRMQPATQSSLRVALQRTYTSTDLPKGLDVVLRGYVRHRVKAASSASVPTCRLALHLTPVNPLEQPFTSDLATETRPGWSYLLLRSRVPYDVAQFQVLLDCNTTADAPIVEWTTVGLFPDPDMACQCPRGFYYNNGGCLRCPAGSYCMAGMRQRCPLGYFTFGKADHCEKCRDGWICVDGLVRLCEPGTYVTSGSTCVVCPSGYACRNGKKMICPVGTFSLPQASDCQSCPPGTISTSEGASTCSKCPLGATSNFQRDHCVLCDDGEFSTYSAQHPCSSCVATSFSRLVQRETCMTLT